VVWAWLQKLRQAMVHPGRARLYGHVEVDEMYIGGTKSGRKRSLGTGKKKIVAIAIEVHFPREFRCTYATYP